MDASMGQAYRMGLINRVVRAERLREESVALARKIVEVMDRRGH
jgi:enoyl-CoA hydratase/carnithine racemase